jgi:hypothetical protein
MFARSDKNEVIVKVSDKNSIDIMAEAETFLRYAFKMTGSNLGLDTDCSY